MEKTHFIRTSRIGKLGWCSTFRERNCLLNQSSRVAQCGPSTNMDLFYVDGLHLIKQGNFCIGTNDLL